MVLLDEFAEAIFSTLDSNRSKLAQEALTVSELTLSLTLSDEYFLEFETLGQMFLLTPKGIFTFNELGETLTLSEDFKKALESYLSWRLKVLVHFSV